MIVPMNIWQAAYTPKDTTFTSNLFFDNTDMVKYSPAPPRRAFDTVPFSHAKRKEGVDIPNVHVTSSDT